MSNTPEIKGKNDIIKEEKLDKINFSCVAFRRSWAFWESYQGAEGQDYDTLNKKIYEWDNIIEFFQFWHAYPGSDVSNIFYDGENIKKYFKNEYRINAINIFVKDVKPMWEDPKNAGGHYLQCEYNKISQSDILKFEAIATGFWKKLILMTMGEILPSAECINGLRFVDKVDFQRGNQIKFRIEIWLSKEIKEEDINKLKEELKPISGCEDIVIKGISM